MSNPGQVLSGVVGGVIGFAVGGPAGALYGFQIGTLVGSVISPTQLPGVEGPRLTDFETIQSDPGAPVFVGWGTFPVPGFRMYLGEAVETASTEEVGGKGPPEQDVTTFTYKQTLALGLCAGPIVGITRVWENGKLVYDARPQQPGETLQDAEARLEMSEVYADTFVLYLGDEDQLPDPTLELEQGAGNVPAFRGLAYMVFPERLLQDEQGKRHPVFKIEVRERGATQPASTIVAVASVASAGSQLMHSEDDGHTWTFPSVPVGPYRTVAHSPPKGITIAISSNAHVIRSLDGGKTWTDVGQVLPSGLWNDCIWIDEGGEDGWFLAVGSVAGTQAATSVDGITWIPRATPNPEGFTRSWASVAHSRPLGITIAGLSGGGTTSVRRSADSGATWAVVHHTLDCSGSNVVADPETGRIIVGDNNSSNIGNTRLLTSGDGSAFVGSIATSGAGGITSLVIGDGVVIMSTPWTGSPTVFTQTLHSSPVNPLNWTIRGDLAPYASIRCMLRLNSGDIIGLRGPIGSDHSRLIRSEDNGVTWTTIQGPTELASWSDMVVTNAPAVTTRVPIADVLEEICALAGVTDVDASELEDEVNGYVLTRETSAIAAIQPLRMVGFFDVVERGSTVRFPARGGAAVAAIEDEELAPRIGADPAAPAVVTTKAQDFELPRRIRLTYLSLARDYERGEQLSPSRLGTVGVNELTVEVPVVLEDDHAAQAAEVMWRDAWVGRWSEDFALVSRHALEPADVVLMPIDERLQRVRVVTIDDSNLMLRRMKGVRDDDGTYISTAVADPPTRTPSALTLLGGTDAHYLDLPALREEDDNAGFYLAGNRTGVGTTWRGARVSRSVDGQVYSVISALGAQAVVGTVLDAPGGGDGRTWEKGAAYEVELVSGELESRTNLALYSGANTAAVGAHGRWHLFQFGKAELIGARRYRLTRLLLGRRGTEHLISTVLPGDTFVLVSGPGIYRALLQTAEIGADRLYRAVTNGAPFDSAEDEAFAGDGQALVPFAPVRVRFEVDGSDLVISWIRRDRLGQTLRDGVETPMSEDEEAYEVDILSDTLAVLRTLETAEPSVTYAAADQVADFGSTQERVNLRIYQLSGVVGRGIPFETLGISLPGNVVQYIERLARPIIVGSYLYAHRARNVLDIYATAVLQLTTALEYSAGVAFADVVTALHVFSGEIWAVGVSQATSPSSPGSGKLWRFTIGDTLGAASEVSSIDVDSPVVAAGAGEDLYVLRLATGNVYTLLRVNVETVGIDDQASPPAGAEIIGITVNDDYVFLLRVGGTVSRYDRDLAFVDDTSGFSASARGIQWDPVAEQLYITSPSTLTAADEDLNELWTADYGDTAIDGSAQVDQPNAGLNLAIDSTRGEVCVAVRPNEIPTGVPEQEVLFVARFDDATGAYVGRYPIRGVVQAVMGASGGLYVNTFILNYGTPITETHRFVFLPSAYLASIEEP